MHYFSII